MRTIVIRVGSIELKAELFDTPTADAIWQVLPIASTASTWGEEVYFAVPVTASLEADAKDVVEAGRLLGRLPT